MYSHSHSLALSLSLGRAAAKGKLPARLTHAVPYHASCSNLGFWACKEDAESSPAVAAAVEPFPWLCSLSAVPQPLHTLAPDWWTVQCCLPPAVSVRVTGRWHSLLSAPWPPCCWSAATAVGGCCICELSLAIAAQRFDPLSLSPEATPYTTLLKNNPAEPSFATQACQDPDKIAVIGCHLHGIFHEHLEGDECRQGRQVTTPGLWACV